jgi:hypothetical protein
MINEIWEAYARVYEAGDEALDRLIGCPAYSKWLETSDMEDWYLVNASPYTLEQILAELKGVEELFAW